MFFEKLEYFEN